MSPSLFQDIVFGPIRSRRLGISLGVNILSTDQKICSFNCLYCECGWNPQKSKTEAFVPRQKVKAALEQRLIEAVSTKEKIDVITFAGNGEPTLHPDFAEIIEDTILLREKYLPVPIAVLSNSTMLKNEKVRAALLHIELPILKLDSAIPATIKILNNVSSSFNVEEYINCLKFMKGKAIIQTMFIRGSYNGQTFDNTTDLELAAWLKLIIELNPIQVQIYTLHRLPPATTLERVEMSELIEIRDLLTANNIKVQMAEN
ncbi:MAG: radical SAM protein [Bacteroidetes bacterium HGW-Bacteroidetes-21]|jgi:wyosine [tRNA(Phe)-imidazoG37] synthetase (radical SAM superfamily)|nr:MAG: radical SAM protein [Bacteroidetes bacterium HGW-Bacteroidetes-21]